MASKMLKLVFIHTLNIHIPVPVKLRARPKTGYWAFSSKLDGDIPALLLVTSFLCM